MEADAASFLLVQSNLRTARAQLAEAGKDRDELRRRDSTVEANVAKLLKEEQELLQTNRRLQTLRSQLERCSALREGFTLSITRA